MAARIYAVQLPDGAFNTHCKSAYLVTIVRTILGTALGVIVTACAAYAMACPTLPGKKFFPYVILIPFVFSGGLIPYYLTLFRLGLINTFWVFVLPGLFNIWNMFVHASVLYRNP